MIIEIDDRKGGWGISVRDHNGKVTAHRENCSAPEVLDIVRQSLSQRESLAEWKPEEPIEWTTVEWTAKKEPK